MTNTLPEVSVFTQHLPQGKDPAQLGFTNTTKPTRSPDLESLIYLAEQNRARAKAASVPPNSQ